MPESKRVCAMFEGIKIGDIIIYRNDPNLVWQIEDSSLYRAVFATFTAILQIGGHLSMNEMVVVSNVNGDCVMYKREQVIV